MGKVRNFDDLGKDEEFSYKGKTYIIPAITQSMSEELGRISKTLQESLDSKNYEEANKLMFKYVAAAMSPKHKEKELREELPKLVISEVMNIIATEMLMVGGKIIEGEDKEQAKKT